MITILVPMDLSVIMIGYETYAMFTEGLQKRAPPSRHKNAGQTCASTCLHPSKPSLFVYHAVFDANARLVSNLGS
jgi:hypothetical protein